ncbi:MAG: chromosomal replication initiator protein DnaA [Oscillospiraceae bacterium]|nr:chromosomal replication initiator protein DnaA [Oscillospiraceae bacterium]
MFASAYVWAKIISYLEEQLSSSTVSAWFDDAEVLEFTDDHLFIYCPDAFRRDMISRRCTPYIQDALRELFDSTAKLRVLDDEELKQYRSKGSRAANMDINPNFTFENFVVGPSNRLASNAAQAVAKNAGQVYNPLFIYGPPGVGKTHLLHAIANGLYAQNPEAKIVNIKGEQFTIELMEAIRTGNNIAFRSKYREADLFLIDDIQFIAGKEATQEEFFHTFNALHENGRQIVITSDRKPGDMLTLETRLQSRFESGLMADIQPPDYETRMAIIRNKAIHLGLELPAEVCDYIAVNVTSNVRQIEGTVKKIMAYRDLNNMPLDLPNVSRAISDMFKTGEGSALPTPSLIISQVCKFYSVDESTLRSTQKNRGTAEARQVAVYLIRKLTNLSTPDIGKELNRDHATILYSVKKVEQALAKGDTNMQNHIRDITANINSCL